MKLLTVIENLHPYYYPFGMIKPNSANVVPAVSYRFGFNGKEKDDEIKGTGNSLDFGARIYDPRSGRWLSVDPLEAQFAFKTPYAFANNSPIIIVDEEGKDDVIYLVVLPSCKNKMKVEDIQKLVDQANNNFERMGLKTRVVPYTHSGSFTPKNIDPTDSYAFLGSAGEIQKTLSKPEFSGADIDKSWAGGFANPEASGSRNGIAIDVNSLKDAAKESKTDAVSFGAYLINHGAGHNADVAHGQPEAVIMLPGSTTNAYIHQMDNPGGYLDEKKFPILIPETPSLKELCDFIDPNPRKNGVYIEKMVNRFGNNAAKDNYNSNRKRNESTPSFGK